MTVTPGDRPDTAPEPTDIERDRRLADLVAERYQLPRPVDDDQVVGQAAIAPAWRIGGAL